MDAGTASKTRRVALVLANAMAVRNTLETPVLSELAQQEDLEVCFITPDIKDAAKVIGLAHGRFSWADLGNPAGQELTLCHGPKKIVLRRLLERIALKPFRKWIGWGNLVFRFNERQNFRGHQLKKNLPPERRKREILSGNYPDPDLGRPFAKSKAIYKVIYNLYHSKSYSEPSVESFIDNYQPHLIVIHHLQNQAIRPWLSAARRRKLPVLGIVGSWDQPTTKGPMPPGLKSILVQSQAMKQELVRHHRIQLDRINVTGWPQMDFYCRPDIIVTKEAFAKELNISPQNQIILFGANTERLGLHEIGIISHVEKQLKQGFWGKKVSLVIRPHPKDDRWMQRLGSFHAPPQIITLPCESGRLEFLANLLAHASVVLASTGTFLLDAVALDTCAVNIAFDGDLKVDHQSSIGRWKELDHYAPVLSTGAIRTATCFKQLDEIIKDYLSDPSKDANGRALCRFNQLEPFDGRASRRIVARIVMEAFG